jgi:hypothetical protein
MLKAVAHHLQEDQKWVLLAGHAAGKPARTGRVSTTRAVPSTLTGAVIVHVQVMRNGGNGFLRAVTYAERVTTAELVGTPHGRRPVADKGPPAEHVPYPAAATAAAFRTATQLFLDQLKQFTDMIQAAGTTSWTDTAGRPGTELAREVLEHMRSMVEYARAPTAHLDTFLQELRAKRALIGALQLQLTAFEQQMDILEQALKPLHDWGQEWSTVQRAITDTFVPPTPNSTRDES